MTTFIEQLAAGIIAEHGTDLRGTAVVLPSQRAGLYLRAALASAAGRTLWSPDVFTLGTFAEQVSGLRAMPMDELLFEAYEAYRTIVAKDARSLDDFMQWAPATLADISEVDAHLLPLDGFYRDLRSWEEIDWSFNTDPLSDGQQRMVRYWAMVGKLHAALNERLLARNAGTAGLVERMAAQRDRSIAPWRTVWFAGLNAFTAAQGALIERLHGTGRARFAWDVDEHYLNDPAQEAGRHAREAIARFGPGTITPSRSLGDGGSRIDIVRAPNKVAQAWCAADAVHGLADDARARAAIVLADASLLLPILEALTPGIGALNITMGLSIAELPVGPLFAALHTLLAGAREGTGFFHADVERLLRHPFLQDAGHAGRLKEATDTLNAYGRTFLPAAFVREALRGVHVNAFHVFADPSTDILARTRALISWASEARRHDVFATEQLYQASLAVQRAHRLIHRYGHALDPKLFASVMGRVMRAARVGLFGEPLTGLQVMGLLEARALDFRRLIIVGAEEGKLPSAGIDRSYIPFELRREYKLPLRDSADAVQAYNFLRAIQRAERVTLIYADAEEGAGPSRYIAQMQRELPDAGNRVISMGIDVPSGARAVTATAIANDEGTRDALRVMLAQGLSPTAFGTWLRCPLDFWFRHVARSREPEEASTRISANTLGVALHATVEELYRPWIGGALVADELKTAADRVPERLRARVAAARGADDVRHGEPLLQMGMAAHAARGSILNEARAVERGARIVPLALEQELRAELPSAPGIIGTPAFVRGRLDRIDERSGAVHILDLKTGRVDGNALGLKDLSLDALRGDKRYGAQLLLYAWLYLSAHPAVPFVRAGLLPLQRPSESDGVYLRIGDGDRVTRAHLPVIERVVMAALSKMLDPATIFMHDEESKYCAFCAAR